MHADIHGHFPRGGHPGFRKPETVVGILVAHAG